MATPFLAGRRSGTVDILTTTRHLRDVLAAKGYPVVHAEHASGHDYLQWRGTLACGLMALLGEPARVDAAAVQACPALKPPLLSGKLPG